MEIEIRTLGLSKSSWATPVTQTYLKKIQFFHPSSEFKLIKSEKDFLKGVEPKDWVVVCDERGRLLNSHEWSKEMGRWLESGKRKLYVFIGGPFGLPPEVRERADISLGLSSLVMNQEVALVVLLEQLFRGFTLLKGHPYHNE